MKSNLKFVRNILITLVALILVAIIINFTPGYKRDRYKGVTNLIIGKENLTEYLMYQIYFDKDGEIYLSKEDTERLIIENNKIEINNVNMKNFNIITQENIQYINVGEIVDECNMQKYYINESNVLILQPAELKLKKSTIAQEANLQFKPRKLSKIVDVLHDGEEVFCYEDVIKGWRLVRTELGQLGYVQEENLTWY